MTFAVVSATAALVEVAISADARILFSAVAMDSRISAVSKMMPAYGVVSHPFAAMNSAVAAHPDSSAASAQINSVRPA
jgi:hypothetical protein